MSITTQTETILTTLPLPTVASVPPENFRFVPGSAMVTNSTINPRITNGTHKSPFFNGTGYYIEEETEQGLSELQTLLLACIATFIPLIISVLAIFGVRMLWRKYKKYKNCNNYDGDVLHERDNSEPLSKPLSSHLFNSDQIKCSETHLSITGEDMEICDGSATGASEPQTTHSTSHSSTNGSIITMTLKNNHLIVETEERSDLEEDSRETTMKYSPGARDGVFVVEVQQGSRRSPGSESNKETSKSTSNQCALVHNPPDRYNAEKRSEEASELGKKKFTPEKLKSNLLNLQLKTGLTQSNSSLTSSSQVYRYGNQVGYDSGFYGYSTYNDSIFDEPIPKPEVTSKPKIISELFKNRSDSKCSPDEYLMSDSALMNRGPSEMDDPIQQEQTRLGNSIYAEKSAEKSKKDLWQRNDAKKFENLYAVH